MKKITFIFVFSLLFLFGYSQDGNKKGNAKQPENKIMDSNTSNSKKDEHETKQPENKMFDYNPKKSNDSTPVNSNKPINELKSATPK